MRRPLACRPGAGEDRPPNPVLYLTGAEIYTAGSKNWVRYRYDVLNKSSYPAQMLAPAPALPLRVTNTSAS